MQNKTGLKDSIVNVSVLFVSLCLCFIIGEAGARFVSTRSEILRNNFKYVSYPDGRAPKIFRKTIYLTRKPTGTFRIIALGDSFTWGDFLSDNDDLWTSVLQKDLQAAFPDKRIEVINCAVRGFTTANECEFLYRHGVKLEPDLIIVQFSLNDPLPSNTRFRRVGGEWLEEDTVNIFSNNTVHEKLISGSKFYAFLNDRFKALQYKMSGTTIYDQLYMPDFKGWVDCQKGLYFISKLAHIKKIGVVLMITPVLDKGRWTQDTYPYRSLYDKVATVGETVGMHILDLVTVFIDQKKDFRVYRALDGRDGHPNVAAHKIFADAMSEYLKKNNLIE